MLRSLEGCDLARPAHAHAGHRGGPRGGRLLRCAQRAQVALLFAPVALAACDAQRGAREAPEAAASASSPAAPERVPAGPEFLAASPSGDVAADVGRAMAAASARSRTLVVYVGATWCEPCQRFHHAVEAGELNGVAPLARVRFLEFDLDRDRERLVAAGYQSKYIPLFALPGPDGRASGKQVEGGIKGDGAVAFIVPRLSALLSM